MAEVSFDQLEASQEPLDSNSVAQPVPTIWTPANIVTCIRIVFVPIWVAFALSIGPGAQNGSTAAGLVVALTFLVLSLTDKLDGYLARSRGEVTRFGKFLDPIADKLVVVAALLVLMNWGYINLWVIIIIIAREFLVSALRMVVATDGIVVAASNLGKWKTATTMGSICGYLVVAAVPTNWPITVLRYVTEFALVAALILTIWSGVDYFLKCKDALLAPEAYEDSNAGPQIELAYDERATWEDAEVLAAQVLQMARERGLTLGTAESCTGGLVEGALTSVPGSSDVVKGAIGSYSNSVKHFILGVSQQTLNGPGAVSSQCAEQMAWGACRALGCDIAVSVTGIAGPGGGTPDKPVGLVWFGASRNGMTYSERCIFTGDRESVRIQSVMHALDLFTRTF